MVVLRTSCNHAGVTTLVLKTDHGPANAHLHDVEAPRGALVLGHGAGGGVAAKDLVETRDVALAAGLSVALVEQPYRVAGRRSPPPAWQLDVVWMTVIDELLAVVEQHVRVERVDDRELGNRAGSVDLGDREAER